MIKFDLSQISSMLISPQKAVSLSNDEWFYLILLLREAKLLASFYHLSHQSDSFRQFPEHVQRHLKSDCVKVERQSVQTIYECVTLTEVLAEIDVQPIYMKGANYILRGSGNSLGRIISDLDVLVEKQDLQKVEKLLKEKLWQSNKLSDYDEKYYRKWAHEIPPMYHLLRDTVLDIHHNIYLPISGRSPNIESFRQGCNSTQGNCLVLSDAATVLHSIIHLFMNEDFTNAYRDMLDIHLLLNEFETNEFWIKLRELATTSGFEKELYYGLILRNRLFGCCYIDSELVTRFENKRSNYFIHNILYHALTPKHYVIDTYRSKVARFIIFIRGHWMKMPPHVLFSHLIIKSYIGIVEAIVGKYYFDKN